MPDKTTPIDQTGFNLYKAVDEEMETFYANIPVGTVHAFDLINFIKEHYEKINTILARYECDNIKNKIK